MIKPVPYTPLRERAPKPVSTATLHDTIQGIRDAWRHDTQDRLKANQIPFPKMTLDHPAGKEVYTFNFDKLRIVDISELTDFILQYAMEGMFAWDWDNIKDGGQAPDYKPFAGTVPIDVRLPFGDEPVAFWHSEAKSIWGGVASMIRPTSGLFICLPRKHVASTRANDFEPEQFAIFDMCLLTAAMNPAAHYTPLGLMAPNGRYIPSYGWNHKDKKITAIAAGTTGVTEAVANVAFDYCAYAVGCALALLNNPRFVTHRPAGTRQQRRRIQRTHGYSPDAHTEVKWNVFNEVKNKPREDFEGTKQPLHFRRSHWRKAQPENPMSVRRPNALKPSDRELWWQWIDGYWAGHPAFGYKKPRYKPIADINK